MTGIERLRALANGDASHEIGNDWFLTAETFESIADQIEREIDEAVADEVAWTLSAYEMNTNARWHSAVEEGAESDCKVEYDLISRYWLPRPRFEDGKPAQWCDEYVEGGEVGRVEHIDYSCIDGNVECMVWSCGTPIAFGSWGLLERPEPELELEPEHEPEDTWGRLERDVDTGRGFYDMDKAEAMEEVLRRCKKLAGVEE